MGSMSGGSTSKMHDDDAERNIPRGVDHDVIRGLASRKVEHDVEAALRGDDADVDVGVQRYTLHARAGSAGFTGRPLRPAGPWGPAGPRWFQLIGVSRRPQFASLAPTMRSCPPQWSMQP
jgi:hypothetical protein